MNLRQYLQKFIQGWLPNQHPVVLAKKMSKPIWWKPFWSIAWIYTEILGIVGFLVLRIPIWYVGIIGGYLGIIGVSAAFYSVIKHSSMNRATYILVGMTTLGLLLSVTYTFMLGHYTIAWLSGWFNLIIIVGIQIAGGVVGGLIGKQRDYQTLPIGFDDIAQTSRMSDRDKAVKLKVVSVLLGVLGVLVGWSAAGYAYVFFVGIGVTSYYATVYSVILWLFVIGVFWLAAFKLKKIQQVITERGCLNT